MLRIGVVDFLNAWPLWGALENQPGLELIRDVPSALARKLRAGEVDCALISSVEYFNLPPGYKYLDSLCIAADREVCSIRLFAARGEEKFPETLSKLRRIYTDAASRSSVAQLQVMLRELKVDIPLEETGDARAKIPRLMRDEGLLAIGDTALSFRDKPSYDLQTEYYALFGRGFVYALWVYREEFDAELAPALRGAYQAYQADALRFRATATQRFGFTADFTEKYLTRIIRHELTAERRADLEFFQRKKSG